MVQAIRKLAILALLAGLAACSAPANVDAPRVPMGDFDLGFNVVAVDNPEVLPFSRNASDQEWKTKMTAAIEERFGDYDGDKLYHIGVKVEAYALAIPGVPVLFTPKSALVIVVNFWDDAAQKKLNAEPKSFTVFESLSPETMVSSGLTQSKDKQMTILTQNAAKMIQDWILENPEWIGLPPKAQQSPSGETGATDAAPSDEASVIEPAAQSAETGN